VHSIHSLWIYTMTRCLLSLVVLTSVFAAALPLSAQAASSTQTYPARLLPPQSLRGELVVTAPPQALLNGQSVQLAPGARIRGQNNMMVMSGQAIGQKLVVNYTADTYGLVMDVWILRPEELERRWPKTPEEAAKWRFDPQTQTWTKP
jgi:hypothetical protein